MNKFLSTITLISHVTLIQIVIGISALFASAQLNIPLKPIPVTFQTSVITLIALTYSPKLTFTTVSSYILLGGLGLPMFSNFNGGLAYLLGPSAGYVIGMLVSAQVMALLKCKLPDNFFGYGICGLVGIIITLTLGVLWLTTFIGLNMAFMQGFLIFIPTGCLKIILQTIIIKYIKQHAN